MNSLATGRWSASRAIAGPRARPSVVCRAQSVIRCPFSISPPAGKAKPKPSPLDLTNSPNTVGANYWLAAGKPGQDVPGKLVSGIHRLYEQGHFLLEDPDRLAYELSLKEDAFATKRDVVVAAEERSLPAQQELLELFIEVLPAYYPDLYTLEGEGDDRVITINFPDGGKRVYAVKDFADCPIELCGRLVQEDFALLRISDEPGPSPQEAKHVMTAACVVFSFHGLAEKLGTTTLNIHAPVPGFEEQLEKLLNRTFTALQVCMAWNQS
eukprot:GHUV01012959.1.p1 GENE.GHUV01012959.1~~GHUV01012959.1.p1  ORF type:complete len:268 (+),score=57.85 GHUV01012959.1:431-1234(+)